MRSRKQNNLVNSAVWKSVLIKNVVTNFMVPKKSQIRKVEFLAQFRVFEEKVTVGHGTKSKFSNSWKVDQKWYSNTRVLISKRNSDEHMGHVPISSITLNWTKNWTLAYLKPFTSFGTCTCEKCRTAFKIIILSPTQKACPQHRLKRLYIYVLSNYKPMIALESII